MVLCAHLNAFQQPTWFLLCSLFRHSLQRVTQQVDCLRRRLLTARLERARDVAELGLVWRIAGRIFGVGQTIAALTSLARL